MNDLLSFNVMSTPALVINDKVVSSGRIPSLADIQKWLTA